MASSPQLYVLFVVVLKLSNTHMIFTYEQYAALKHFATNPNAVCYESLIFTCVPHFKHNLNCMIFPL